MASAMTSEAVTRASSRGRGKVLGTAVQLQSEQAESLL